MKPEFDESTIRALATDQSFYRGQDYFEGGMARGLVLEGDAYKAYVQGTRRYTVRVWEESGEIETSCSCPYDWGGACKHVVAVMLAVLRQEEGGEGFKQMPETQVKAAIPVDELLESLSIDKLRAFLRRQIDEAPQLAENLQIFAQGPQETERTVEEYATEIAAALEEGDYVDPDEYEHYYYAGEREFDEDDSDSVEEILRPFLDTARRYQEQGNWIENTKIQEAVAHACGRMVGDGSGDYEDVFDEDEEEDDEDYYDEDEFDDEEGDEEGEDESDEDEDFADEDSDEDDSDEDEFGDDEDEYEDEGVPEFVWGECHRQAEKALERWSEALGGATPQREKWKRLECLAIFLVQPPCHFNPDVWEKVFGTAVTGAREAKKVLDLLEKQQGKGLEGDAEKVGVLLHLLDLSGDAERFLKVGKRATRQLPHLALAVGEKLVELDRKAEAVGVAEKTLAKTGRDPYSFDYYGTRQSLLRFLVRTYDRRKDYKKLVTRAEELFFATQDFDDYLTARDLLRTKGEREEWIQEVKEKGTAAALLEILPAEERWEDLLKSARKHRREAEFSRMMELLQERFPRECFKLYRQVVLEVADSGADRHVYRQVADHARRLQKIPGHEEAFGELMAELVETYSRRSGLMRELGALAELGKEWRGRARKARFEKVKPAQLKKMGLDELIEICPVGGEEDMEKLRGQRSSWQRSSAALVWAILIKEGRKLDAAEISEAIAAYRGCQLQSAGSQRSNGLRMLQALGYVEVERQGNRLGEVRLLKKK